MITVNNRILSFYCESASQPSQQVPKFPRGVLAALALGADGIYMGTRFMVTRESESHTNVKEAIVKGQDACAVSVPKDFMLARDLANNFTKEYMEIRAAGATAQEISTYS